MRKEMLKLYLEQFYQKSGLAKYVDPIKSKYDLMPPDQQKLAISGGLVLLIALNALFVLSPMLTGVTKLRAQVEGLEIDIRVAQDDIKNRKKYKDARDVAIALQGDLDKGVLPQAASVPFLDTLAELAKSSGISVESLKPIDPKARLFANAPELPKGYQHGGYELKAYAGYHEVGSFLNSIEKHEIAMSIQDFEIYHSSEAQSRDSEVVLRIFLIKRDDVQE